MSDDFVNQFLDSVVDATFETRMTPTPAGDYVNGRVKAGSVTVRPVDFKNGRFGKELSFDIILESEEAKAATGLAEPTVKFKALLDFTRDLSSAEDNAPLAAGANKNIKLGALREALGQNTAPWSFRSLDGAGPIPRIKVIHRPDKNDATRVYAEVAAVSK